MDRVVTLIVKPGDRASLLKAGLEAERIIAAAGAQVGERVFLADDGALDLPFTGGDPEELSVALGVALAALPVDHAVQRQDARRARLLLADMDSTMITVECIDELADFAGIKDAVARVTEAAMRGELDFEGALTERVALLAGMDATVIDRCLKERVRLTSGARPMMDRMVQEGVLTALVSGGFTAFTDRVAADLGFHITRANRLDIQNGKLTGRVIPPICGAETKLETLRTLKGDHLAPGELVMAVGDGANDAAMLEAADMGVAFHAKPRAKEAANVVIDHGDLTALLYLQGLSPEH
ncbi:phosphoserine phosphatase SerB [Yunchengibacter salinarum]|uniref:phosphoserine phosphatase SerB n=1 Tax=Yunchengibacter salinarum TaxID=3133399 RepID=UPI0035B57A52